MSWRAGSVPPVMHHPLESHVVDGDAVSVTGGDAALTEEYGGSSTTTRPIPTQTSQICKNQRVGA